MHVNRHRLNTAVWVRWCMAVGKATCRCVCVKRVCLRRKHGCPRGEWVMYRVMEINKRMYFDFLSVFWDLYLLVIFVFVIDFIKTFLLTTNRMTCREIQLSNKLLSLHYTTSYIYRCQVSFTSFLPWCCCSYVVCILIVWILPL